MNSDSDSVNVIRPWSGSPQPSGGANTLRCLWCFTPLMNLHDFVIEPFNPVQIFRDAHSVPFCLTADHISTCLMSLCTLQASTVLVCSGHVVNGKCSICSYRWDTVGDGSSTLVEFHERHNHGVPPGLGGKLSHSWSTMRKLVGRRYTYGVP